MVLCRRRAIAEGNITVEDYTRAFPYPADVITTFGLRGEHLLLALEHSVSLANETTYDISQGVGRFLQVLPHRTHARTRARTRTHARTHTHALTNCTGSDIGSEVHLEPE